MRCTAAHTGATQLRHGADIRDRGSQMAAVHARRADVTLAWTLVTLWHWTGRAAMRLLLFMVLMVVAAASHAQPTAAPTPPVKAPAALRNADEASEKSKLEAAAAKTKKLDDAEAARQRKLADEKIARTEANWKKVMGSICTGCVPRNKPVPVSR